MRVLEHGSAACLLRLIRQFDSQRDVIAEHKPECLRFLELATHAGSGCPPLCFENFTLPIPPRRGVGHKQRTIKIDNCGVVKTGRSRIAYIETARTSNSPCGLYAQ